MAASILARRALSRSRWALVRHFAVAAADSKAVKARLAAWDALVAAGQQPQSIRQAARVSSRNARVAVSLCRNVAPGFVGTQVSEDDLHPASSAKEVELDLACTLMQVLQAVLPDAANASGLHSIVAARVNGKVLDLSSALEDAPSSPEGALDVAFLPAYTVQGQAVYWHSAAHVLGFGLEAAHRDDIHLTDGPAVSEGGGGFFYEAALPRGHRLHVDDAASKAVLKAAKGLVKDKAVFQRLTVPREVAMEAFADNPFKVALLQSLPDAEPITLYRCGPFVDLCRGPHVPHTGLFKGLAVTRVAGSHWQGDLPRLPLFSSGEGEADDQGVLLQRAYGVAFPDAATLDKWREYMAEAARRDHRVVGASQGLFMFHPHSPGSAFMLPHGMRVYNTLVNTVKAELSAGGYEEVMTPQLFRPELWQTSGHWQHYQDDMFGVADVQQVDGRRPPSDSSADLFGLKPMNCPAHCLIFGAAARSYRDLPFRVADFSSLHRNEASGALGGLTRLRRFHQDDAHIFCTPGQVQQEVLGCLAMVGFLYAKFGLKFKLRLSTR